MSSIADDDEHSACVNAWMERTTKNLPSEQLCQLFERAFSALWRRAHQTLGDVTLAAIVDRVLYNASEEAPILLSLRVEEAGIDFQLLRERAHGLHQDQLEEGIRLVLVEFLTVLGNLTADILTPALHAELSKVVQEDLSRAEEGSRSTPENLESKDGKGAAS